MEIANLVKKVVQKEFKEKEEIKIIKENSDDKRSYHINSDKIKDILNFTPKILLKVLLKISVKHLKELNKRFFC